MIECCTGWVHDSEHTRFKASPTVAERKEEVGRKCNRRLELVYDKEQLVVAHAYKLERLVHTELSYFQRRRHCRCRNTKSEHHEWYEISDEEAVNTVQIWRRFVQMSPYKSNGNLSAFWEDRVNTLKEPREELDHQDHQLRHERWAAFASPFQWEILLYRVCYFFSDQAARERPLKRWYLLLLSIAALVIQAQNYGLVSTLSWGVFLTAIFVDMLE